MHDIGKVGMPDRILKGNEMLTVEDRYILREHVIDGFYILNELQMPQVMLDIVRYHHERYEGSGYLEGLRGTTIPLAGRIAAITDTYSALTSERPYSSPLSHEQAIGILRKDYKLYEPIILEYFINMF